VAKIGGTIALVQENDSVAIDAMQLLIQLDVNEAEIAKRKALWSAPKPQYTRRALGKHFKLAGTD
jgi:dihydroxy-acid dehydratase